MQDISASGTKIAFAAAEELPLEFVLEVPALDLRVKARLVWSQGKFMGSSSIGRKNRVVVRTQVHGSVSSRPFGLIDSLAANVVLSAKHLGAFVLKPDRLHELIAIRTALGLSQSAMAHLLELTTRDYQAFEWGEGEIPNHYILAAERIAMAHAVLHGAPMKAPPELREEALALTRLMESQLPAEPSA